MRKVFCLLFLFIFVKPVTAVELGETMVRLERNKAGETPLPILVTVKTENTSIENDLKVTVGNGWSVSNPEISTNNLPDGIIPWPGLGIEGINGKEISFNSGDLSGNLSYGFFIIDGIGNNPIDSIEDNRKWKVAAGGAQTEVKVLVVENDQITVTGKVGANASDFQLNLESTVSGTLKQNEEIGIKVRYGTYLSSTVRPLIISVEWGKGTVEGQPLPTVDIVDYKIGSATATSNGILPVIDPVNRVISWTIPSFPANLRDEEVSLILKTNSNYTGSAPVNFWVKAVLSGASVLTTDSQKIFTYQYDNPIMPTSTPTQDSHESSMSPTSAPIQLTPTEIVSQPIIKQISITSITPDRVNLVVMLSENPENVRVRYGDSLASLNKSVVSINKLLRDIINLDGLSPGKVYYFRVEVTGKDGNVVKSEIYTFRTPEVSGRSEADLSSVVVSSQDNIVTDARSEEKTDFAKVVLPIDNLYSFKLNVSMSEEVKEMVIMLRNAQVLGLISVYGAEPNSMENVMMGFDKSGFVGQLVSPTIPGYYEVYVKIHDIYGGIKEQKVADFRVIEPIKIVNNKDEGIEGAKIFLMKFEERLNLYQPLPSQYKGIINPGLTDSEGNLNVALSKGKYRIDVSRFGYSSETVDFTVGMNIDENMPVVKLSNSKFGLLGYLGYFQNIMHDVASFSREHWSNLLSSKRFFSLIGLAEIVFGLGLTWEYIYLSYRRKQSRKSIGLWVVLGEELYEVIVGGILLLMLIYQFVFMISLGWIRVWPFLVLALFNLLLWSRSLLKIEGYEK